MSCGCIDITGAGTAGRDGTYGGFASNWLFDSSSVAAGAASKYLRLNNTTLSLVTNIFVSLTNEDNIEVTAFLDSFVNSNAYGSLRLFHETDNTKFAYFTLTGVTTPAQGGRQLAVTYIAGSGSFIGGDSLVLSFTPKGAAGSNGSNGSNGAAGSNGTNGTNGVYGGFSLPWKHETSTAAGATAQYFRLNNATYSNVTTLYVSTTNSDAITSTNFLAAFENSGLFGYVRIAKQTDGSKFWMGKVTNVVASGAYYTITVSYTLANSTFSAEDACFITFSPSAVTSSAFLYVGKLPSVATVAGFEISDGQKLIPGTTGGDTSVLEDTLSAFNSTTGVWTCPATGYYDMNFLINCNQNGADLGTGFYFAGIADSASGNTIAAYDTKTLATNMREGILQSSYTYRKLTAGDAYAVWFLNRSNTAITGNANGAGGNAGQSWHFSIKRVA